MIFFKLDYVIEMEQAARRDAAQCAARAKRGEAPAEPNALRSKLVGALKSLATEYLTHQSWLAHNGVFAPTPMVSASAGEVVSTERRPNRVRELRKLAGVKLSAREADMVWPRLLEHKWYLGERLGRDVGLRVAAMDFFENIQPPRERAAATRTAWEPLPRLPMMLPFGERT